MKVYLTLPLRPESLSLARIVTTLRPSIVSSGIVTEYEDLSKIGLWRKCGKKVGNVSGKYEDFKGKEWGKCEEVWGSVGNAKGMYGEVCESVGKSGECAGSGGNVLGRMGNV